MVSQNDPDFDRGSFKKISLASGKRLANPPEGEDVVISGMAGNFPDADGIYELKEKLFNKVDMVTDDNRRWKPTNPEVPQRTGKLYDIKKFDAGFFGVSQRHANWMDAMLRITYEKAYEAIVDAGYHPSELVGSNTGVFFGSMYTENEMYCFYQKSMANIDAITGNLRSLISNRLNYYFGLNGPSYNCDNACSTSMFAFEHAYASIRNGVCDRAIVAAAELCLHPGISLQCFRMGILSPEGYCKPFDNDANGYSKSEGVCVVLLEKSKYARRIYAQVVHAKCNCDGYKDNGISYPSTEMQTALLRNVYEECGVDPSTVGYVEAHGTGTKVGDLVELQTLDEVFCKVRDTPLYIGSVKSNIGHNEAVSSLCSIIKVLIAMEAGFIPPNIHFKTNREGVPALQNGKMKVVDEKTAMPGANGLVGLNSYGMGGANAHALLRWNSKEKTNDGKPEDNLPRLVCISGRTREAVETILDDVSERALDTDYIKLLHTIFRKETPRHLYRGYSMIGKNGEIDRQTTSTYENNKRICFIFTGVDCKWHEVTNQLSSIPLFASSMQKIHKVLSSVTDIDLWKIETNSQQGVFYDFLRTVAVQISLVDILKSLGVSPEFIVGIGTGDLLAAYFEDYLTLREVVLSSFYMACVTGRSTSNESDEYIKELEKIIPDKKVCSKKWFPSCHQNDTSKHNMQCSAEYFFQSASSPISTDEAISFLPSNTLSIVIGPYFKNDGIANLIRLVDVDSKDCVSNFLQSLGCLYNNGSNMELDVLYPTVEWPVSRGTPMISPLIKWLHDKDHFVYKYTNDSKMECRTVEVNANVDDWRFITGHVIDGKQIFPAAGYLYLVWDVYSSLLEKLMDNMRISFENVKFIKTDYVTSEDVLTLDVMVQIDSGKFEITEGGVTVVQGRICELDEHDTLANLPHPDKCCGDLEMNQREIYKELKLRGYNYKGLFCGLKSYDVETKNGTIVWSNNWMSFMDCMLQMQMLNLDTRSLFLPISIEKLTIDAPNHMKFITKYADNLLPIYYNSNATIIRCGHVEITDVSVSSIPKRKLPDPLLESYKFVPNDGAFSVEESLRIMLQIILENTNITTLKSLEMEADSHSELLSPLLLKALQDVPLVQPEVAVVSEKDLNLPGVIVKNKDLRIENDHILLIEADVFGQAKSLDALLEIVKKQNGYIISIESVTFDVTQVEDHRIQILCVHVNQSEKLILMRATTRKLQSTVVDVTEKFENWTPKLKNALNENQNVIILSQNQVTNGVLGMVSCLRREPNGDKVSCVFIMDDAPEFDLHKEFYKKQLCKGLTVNVWKDAKWGTYRHLLMEETKQVESEHCYCNVNVPGDLSSLSWIESHLNRNSIIAQEKSLIYVYYAPLNFRDLLTASGRMEADVITMDRISQDSIQGCEFVGRDSQGKRVMGMAKSGALATMVEADSNLLLPVPDEWSMAEAATVPVAYGTAIYALIIRAQMKSGQSVLIHSGTGGVGQAAINIALHYGCVVFTTVGTQEKRDFIKQNFPQIEESHIGNSRDISFEQMVYEQTGGRGVDIVLNSLTEEKLQASIRCLARDGKFLEIGKFDLANDNTLHMQIFSKGASFEGVMLDALFTNTSDKKQIIGELMKCIADGAVKPLTKTIFKDDELEQAFRFMSTGKHIGKVLIQIRQEENEKQCLVPRKTYKGIPRFYCDPEGSYVIVGGLGGFALELADWLVIRGAKKMVLTSRNGIKNGYELLRLKIWQSYGVEILIRTNDASTEEGCTEFLNAAARLGPVKAIFNLAAVLKDGMFSNLNAEDYEITFKPKAYATKQLDVISRKICPQLEHFVMFSTVSSGKGNPAQANYGMANSVVERICEQRKMNGYPALAIQWGSIGDVGMVEEMLYENIDMVYRGTYQQKVSNCLQMLDKFLRQSEPVVASIVIAEKLTRSSSSNIIDAVLNVLGVSDIKAVSLHTTFPELGMNSLMALEIKQIIDREYEVNLSWDELRLMTISMLQEAASGKVDILIQNREKSDEHPFDELLMLRHIGNENASSSSVVHLNSMIKEGSSHSTVYMLPGLEGMALILQPLAEKLNGPVSCLQFCADYNSDTIHSLVESVFKHIEVVNDFKLIAYSFGCVVANELIRLLEKEGKYGKVVFIDGSIDMVSELVKTHLKVDSEVEFQTNILCALMSRYMPIELILKHKPEILKCKTHAERIDYIINESPDSNLSTKYLNEIFRATHARLSAVNSYLPHDGKFKSKMMLIKPTTQMTVDISNDYGLSKWFDEVDVKTLEGDHSTVLENPKAAEEINKFFDDEFLQRSISKEFV